jgi:hypothetical protein
MQDAAASNNQPHETPTIYKSVQTGMGLKKSHVNFWLIMVDKTQLILGGRWMPRCDPAQNKVQEEKKNT